MATQLYKALELRDKDPLSQFGKSLGKEVVSFLYEVVAKNLADRQLAVSNLERLLGKIDDIRRRID